MDLMTVVKAVVKAVVNACLQGVMDGGRHGRGPVMNECNDSSKGRSADS